MRFSIAIATACLMCGCVSELAQMPDLLKQRAEKSGANRAALVKAIVEGAAKSPEPVPAFVVDALDAHLEAEEENSAAIAEIAAAQATWHGPPAERIEAGTFKEKTAVSSLKRKGKMKAAAAALIKSRLGIQPKAGAAPPPPFDWRQLVAWGLAAAGTAGAYVGSKKAKDAGVWKAGARSMSRALGRLKKNGTEKKVLAATDGDDVPDEERVASKAAYRRLKTEGEV